MAATVVENFYGVYILYCENPDYRGRTYIGYTMDPNRRIQQHNKGKHAGGAWRTSNKGPWAMVLIIHGFPNDISALRFEWAWQHPEKSRRLSSLDLKKKSNETRFEFNFKVLSHMLRTGPWNRLALTIQWLKPDYKIEFQPSLLPPAHMPIEYGLVISKRVSTETEHIEKPSISKTLCDVCQLPLEENNILKCIDSSCSLHVHIICLAKHFVKGDPDHVLPLEGNCPSCFQQLLWADLIRKLKGCYQNEDISINQSP